MIMEMMDKGNDISTVLVVDDTPENVDILVDILSDEYDVSVAMDGKTALEDVKENKPDLILLDVMMPGLDGFDVIHELKSRSETKDIPVIFVTAMGEIKDEAKGLSLGAVDYIVKPVNPAIVKARVKNHLELERARKELKKQNEILVENARLRDDVERIIRHDIKTPLNAILSIPGMIMKDGGVSKDHEDMLKMMEESGYRLLDIVNASMDLYKIETGKYKPRAESVDVIGLLKQVRGETRSLLTEKNITVDVLLLEQPVNEDDVFLVRGEEMLVYSMLANLIKNAVEASPVNEKVTVTLLSPDKPEIRILNKGTVPAEIRDTFFDKYVTHGKEDGTGLGTYSAKLIVEALGGTICYETSEEKGTELIISFKKPLPESFAKAMKDDGKIQHPHEKTPDGLKILIADDYMNMRKIVRGILRKLGIKTIFEAKNGNEAMIALETQRMDLVICDWNMPGAKGIDILKFIRSKEPIHNTPFIMVTGESSRDQVLEASQAGVNGYIIKPFSPDILIKRVNSALEIDLQPVN